MGEREVPEWGCNAKRYCEPLTQRLQNRGARKGLVVLEYVNFKTLKLSRRLVIYVSKRGDNGIALNFCPWCGFDFTPSHGAMHDD